MALNIVYEYPSSNFFGRLLRLFVRLLGIVLIVAGILSAAAPVIFVFAIILNLSEGRSLSRIMDASGIQFVGVGTAMMVVCLWLGQRLLRGKRRLVLFLRRFGFADATRVLTFVLTTAVGSSWRMVTLDDARVASVGVGKTARLVTPLFLVTAVLFAVWALVWFLGGGLSSEMGKAMRGVTPQDNSISGLIGSVIGMMVVGLVVGIFLGALVLIVIGLFGGVALYSFGAYLSIRRAERSKRFEITQRQKLESLAQLAIKRSRKIFSPRLIVVRVATAFWQDAVRYFIAQCSAVVIDISEPSENLLWEIATLKNEGRYHWILVGRGERLKQIVAGDIGGNPQIVGRMLALLDSEDVLVYGDDRKSKKRFASALRARLESLTA